MLSPSPILTGRQLQLWDLFRRGLDQAIIAKTLRITRQATSQTLQAATQRMTQALLAAAQTQQLRVERVDPQQGVLEGFSPQLHTRVTILYTLQHGLQTWYHHDSGSCATCPDAPTCLDTLRAEATRRGLRFTPAEEALPPGVLAEILFTRLRSTTPEASL